MASRICHVKPIASAAIAAPITVIFHQDFSDRIDRVGELASRMSTITGLVRFYASGVSKQEGKPLRRLRFLPASSGTSRSSVEMAI
jgi:hypothetical protein